jgi:ketosteroid isomerase-like protein
MDLLEIGRQVQKAYASSIAEGHSAMNAYMASDVSVIHVPAIKADGSSRADTMGRRAAAEVAALKALEARVSIEDVQQAGDDTLIVEMVLSGRFPTGDSFQFPEVMIYTFENERVTRLIAVGSRDMFATLAPVMKEFGYSSDDWANDGAP